MSAPPPHPSLRHWRDDDVEPYVEMHLHPEFARWLGGAFTRERARALLDRDRAALASQGWGMWALQDEAGALVGVAGLQSLREDLPGHPGVEAAWRLHPRAWGRGHVTRAMRAVLDDAFARGVPEVWAMTATSNLRSQAVMRRLGFVHLSGREFDHPRLAAGHPLRRHGLWHLAPPAARGPADTSAASGTSAPA